MTDDLVAMSPIDYMVVEFPGRRTTGDGMDLVDRGIIGILDVVFIPRELDDSVSGVAVADLDGDRAPDLAVLKRKPPLVCWPR